MNIKYTLHGIHFERDSQKSSANLQKHGISLETACEVFHDPFVQVVDEENLSYAQCLMIENGIRKVIIVSDP